MKDPWASRDFYEAVLGFMGYRCVKEDRRGFDWDLVTADGGLCSIGIVTAEGDGCARPHDRYAPGLHHVAWRADSRDDVDRLHARLVEIGAVILDPPAAYPQYGAGYYAVFFADPDGLKLEYVHAP